MILSNNVSSLGAYWSPIIDVNDLEDSLSINDLSLTKDGVTMKPQKLRDRLYRFKVPSQGTWTLQAATATATIIVDKLCHLTYNYSKYSDNPHVLMYFSGTSFQDESKNKYRFTKSGTVNISTAQHKFHLTSLQFASGSLYHNSKNSDGTVETSGIFPRGGDWTFEWWEYRTSTANNDPTFHEHTSMKGDGGMIIMWGTGANRVAHISCQSTDWNILNNYTITAETINQWVHWCWERDCTNNLVRFYKNGVQVLTRPFDGTLEFESNIVSILGGYASGSNVTTTQGTNMFLEDVVLYDYAKYGDSGYDVPTQAWDNRIESPRLISTTYNA